LDAELTAIAEFIFSVSPALPWHVSRLYPAGYMLDRPITEVASLRRAREIGLKAGLKYVYEGNIPGEGGKNTGCPRCRQLPIERYGLYVQQNRICDGRCPDCGETIDGMGMNGTKPAA